MKKLHADTMEKQVLAIRALVKVKAVGGTFIDKFGQFIAIEFTFLLAHLDGLGLLSFDRTRKAVELLFSLHYRLVHERQQRQFSATQLESLVFFQGLDVFLHSPRYVLQRIQFELVLSVRQVDVKREIYRRHSNLLANLRTSLLHLLNEFLFLFVYNHLTFNLLRLIH
jgi:hypothetical protein